MRERLTLLWLRLTLPIWPGDEEERELRRLDIDLLLGRISLQAHHDAHMLMVIRTLLRDGEFNPHRPELWTPLPSSIDKARQNLGLAL